MKKIIVRIAEGMGNQLFMYAHAYALSKKLGEDIISNAYETLILDVFNGNTILFSSSDFVEKAWEIVDPIVKSIKTKNSKLYAYKAGSWGPRKADDIFRNENTWRYPCKNLVEDGETCEL